MLFHSPYEAAAWSIISARTRHAQAVKIRDSLSRNGIFPAPEQLLALRAQLGLPEGKLPRLHAVAEAALEGQLDREPLLAAEPDEALAQLQELPGIGPFYAGLILLRAVGTTDVLAQGEPRLKKAVRDSATASRWRRWPKHGGRSGRGCRYLMRAHDLSSTSSATSRPASRRCT